MNITVEIENHFLENGLTPPFRLITDGEIHRFPTDRNKPSKLDGWYSFHKLISGDAILVYGSWRKPDEKFKINLKAADKMPVQELAAPKQTLEALNPEKIYSQCATLDTHDYCVRKGIQFPANARILTEECARMINARLSTILTGALVIPMLNEELQIKSLQLISEKGDKIKTFLRGHAVAGLFNIVGSASLDFNSCFIAEGIATAQSIYDATGKTVVCAFSAGNVKKVIEKLLSKGVTDITACIDNDEAGEKSVSGLKLPIIKPPADYNDFNDFMLATSKHAVKDYLLGSHTQETQAYAKQNESNNVQNPKEEEYINPANVTIAGILQDGNIVRIAEVTHAYNFLSKKQRADNELLLLAGCGFAKEARKLTFTKLTNYCFDEYALEEFFKTSKRLGWTGLKLENNEELINLQYARTFEDISERWAIALIEGTALFVDRALDTIGFNGWSIRFASINAASKVFGIIKAPVVITKSNEQKEVKWINLYEKWINSRERHTYTSVSFNPKRGIVSKPGFKLPEGAVLDLYEGLTVTPQEGDCDLILSHIFNIWCNKDNDLYFYIIKWLANMYQNPNKPGHTAIALKSEEGAGKNIILDALVKSFGKHGIMVSKPDEVIGRFNDAISTSILVVLNEAFWAGNKQTEGALKSLITDEMLRCEKKFLPSFTVKNCTHIIIASNNEWIAPVSISDRRWIILEVSNDAKGNYKYFEQLANHIKNGGINYFINYLLTLDISDYNPSIIPAEALKASEVRYDNQLRTADTVTQWWSHCLDLEYIYTDSANVETPTNWQNNEELIIKKSAYAAYCEWAKALLKKPDLINSWTKTLKSFGVDVSEYKVTTSKGSRERAIKVPSLGEAKKRFTNKLKGKTNE
jgi:hypothetical protein